MASKKGAAMEELGFIQDEDGSLRIEDLVILPAPAPVLSTDVPVTRLIITHLTVRNFKSYAGEQTIGPFDKNFTAVVGPNGSGKSNVIDSLMFVFGRKSKDIRAKKMTALIHKSDQCPNATSCSVAVNFAMISDDQATNGENVKDSAFIVSRTVQSDNTSYYEICHKRVLYKEVVRTLRAYGIDMEYNRFLIMQGEIESISLMKPKGDKDSSGMLEYVEDIIGSHRFIEPINYFQAKVDELKVQESDKAKVVELFEKEKNELEGPKNNAITYLKLENKHILCENSILHIQRMKIEKDLKGIVDEKEKFMVEVNSLKAEMRKVLESKKSLGSDLAEWAAKQDSILKRREEYSEEFKALVREDAANLLDIKHVKGKIQSSKNGIENHQNEINKLTKQFMIFECETTELQKKKEKFEGEKSVEEKKATEVMGTLKQETKNMQEQKDVLEGDLIKFKDNVYQIKSEMDLIKSELSIYVSGDKKEREKFATLESNHQRNLDSAKKEESLVQEEANQVKDIEKELSSLKEQLSQAKEKELSLFQQHRETRQKWEEARSSQQNTRNSSSLLQGLMNAKASGKLPPGIYGRLGNLGAIDEKYDIAMSTACGRLDNLVTDTMATAQLCVEYLKKHNLGYATFIALDQLKRYERIIHQKMVTPENIPRLFDLIRVNDPAMLPAFYLAIGDTLVATNLEQATRIGLGGSVRHRVVTLEGKVVEPSGAMIGGGNTFIRGKIGQKVVENAYSDSELAEMSARVNTLSKELFDVKQLGVSLEDKISQGTKKLSSLQHSLKKRSLHIKAFKEQVEMITSQITEQEKKMKVSTVDEKKVSELEEKIKAKNKIYKKSVEETTVVEKKVSELQEKILELSKGKFSKAKKTVDQLKKKLDEVTQAITKSTTNMKVSKSKVKKLETKIKGLQSDLMTFEKDFQILKKKRDVLTVKGQEASELVQKHEEELVEFAEKQKDLKKEMATINEKEHAMKLTEVQHKNTLKTYDASESEKRAYIRSINSKVSKLKLSEVEDGPTEIPILSEEETVQLNLQNLQSDLDIMKVQLEDMSPDLSSIKEFEKKDNMYKMNLGELMKVKKARTLQEMRKLELYKKRLNEFMKALKLISIKAKEIYMMLTDGGDAELELVDKGDPFKKGITYSIRPPKKSWKKMCHLSGGEKTLSSLSLVFSLHYYRTTPFYVMDEIDAALDERNVGIIGKYLLENQKNAQFIIVSLRNVMNELPEKLLGVYKINNCTRNLHICSVEQWAATRRRENNNEPSTSKSK